MGARAAASVPEGVKGWWYYIALNKSGDSAIQEEACALTAANFATMVANPKRKNVEMDLQVHWKCSLAVV